MKCLNLFCIDPAREEFPLLDLAGSSLYLLNGLLRATWTSSFERVHTRRLLSNYIDIEFSSVLFKHIYHGHKLEFLSYWSGFDSIIMHLNWLSWSWFSFILDVYRVANCVNIESVGVVSRCLKLFPCTVSTLLYISTDYMHSKVQKLNASSSTQWALSKQWTNCIEVDRNSGQTKSKQESYHRLSKLETDVAAMFTRKSVLEGLNNKLFRSFVAYSLS